MSPSLGSAGFSSSQPRAVVVLQPPSRGTQWTVLEAAFGTQGWALAFHSHQPPQKGKAPEGLLKDVHKALR